MTHKGAKIMATLALLGIIISIVGTGLMFILGNNNNNSEVELTPEQIAEIQAMINSQSGSTTSTGELSGTGNIIETNK